MTRVPLPYLMRQRDHKGRWVWYYRRRQGAPKIRLPGKPGDAEFVAAYHAARAGKQSVRQPAEKTWRWLCVRYFASPEFGALAEATRRQRRNVLEATWQEPIKPGAPMQMGDVPLESFTRQAVRVLRDRKQDHPEAANHRIKAVGAVFRWAIDADLVSANPARDVPPLKTSSDGHHTWTLAEVEQYRRRHPVGTKPRLALELLLCTGARRGDVIRLGRRNVEAGTLVWRMQKTGKEQAIPLLPELAEVIAATPMTGIETWLVTQYGKPFTVAGFGNWFRDRCNEAGLPHCSAHGLRKAGAVFAAENGATDRELMAIFGWESARQVTTYTRQRDRRRQAAKATRLIVAKE